LAREFFLKKNIGIEIPLLPDKEKESYLILKKSLPFVGFII
jgi:hypothetical protein